MKKTLLTIALVATSVAAFAQGKVSFVNDSNHYFVLGTTLAADDGLGGGVASTAANSGTAPYAVGAIPVSPLPSGYTLLAGLYAVAGSTSSGLTLQTTVPLTGANWGPTAGKMAAKPFALTGIPGSAIASFAVVISDVLPASYTGSEAANAHYFGTSGVFQMTPGGSISYPLITTGGGSTWANANLVINAVNVVAVPEPSSFALAGLGAAAMLIFRRRK